jgi:hypothetical protein
MNFNKKILVFILCLLLSTFVSSASPKGEGNSKAKDHSVKDNPSGIRTQVSVDTFLENDHSIIRTHFVDKKGNLPPGLAKRGGDFPPGLEKQLRRNGHLPPGLEKRLTAFPAELEKKLPPLKSGLIRGMIGASAVIMNQKTSVILDVFKVF